MIHKPFFLHFRSPKQASLIPLIKSNARFWENCNIGISYLVHRSLADSEYKPDVSEGHG